MQREGSHVNLNTNNSNKPDEPNAKSSLSVQDVDETDDIIDQELGETKSVNENGSDDKADDTKSDGPEVNGKASPGGGTGSASDKANLLDSGLLDPTALSKTDHFHISW